MGADPEYGETWVYESIVGALPGIRLPSWAAVGLQLVAFEAGLLVLAAYYDLWNAVPAGTAAIVVAAGGSVAMLRIGRLIRTSTAPSAYRALLFGSSIEVVLSVLAFIGVAVQLLVVDPRTEPALLTTLLGPEPPVPAVYLMMLVLWDLCYRIGTGWWASVVSLWGAVRYDFDPGTASQLRRAALSTTAFGLLQVLLVPFVRGYPVFFLALAGHIVAVVTVTTLALVFMGSRRTLLAGG